MVNDRPHYQPLGFAMLRAPLLALDRFHDLDATHAAAGDERPEDAGLSSALSDPLVVEALTVGSFLGDAPKYLHAGPAKKQREARRALLSYLSRMCTRPTPLGLFAGVGTVEFSGRTEMVIDPFQHKTFSRPDMGWIDSLLGFDDLGRPRDLGEYRPNPLILRYGGRVWLPGRARRGGTRQGTVSVRMTPVVGGVLEATKDGLALNSVVTDLVNRHGIANRPRIEALIRHLCDNGFLVPRLRPRLTTERPAERLRLELGRVDGGQPLVTAIEEVEELARRFDRQPMGSRGQCLAAMDRLRERWNLRSLADLLQVDMLLGMGSNTIARSVSTEAARAGNILVRLGAGMEPFPHLVEYRSAFMQRYGQEEIPILELLDPGIGLGPPAGYVFPGGSRRLHGDARVAGSRQRTLLWDLLAGAVKKGSIECELDEEGLSVLSGPVGTSSTAPFSLDVYCSVAARSREAIDAGDFRLIVAPGTGVAGAGRSFGRFCHMFPEKVSEELRDLVEQEALARRDVILAELVYGPDPPRHANVTIRPSWVSQEIALFAEPAVSRECLIAPSDIVVGVDCNRFYVRSLRLGKPIIVREGHLLNKDNSPDICRFLVEVGIEQTGWISGFYWHGLEDAPFLPRVRFGRVVLRPAEWKLPLELIRSSLTCGVEEWKRQLASWYEQVNMPEYCYHTQADHRRLLHMGTPVATSHLQREARKAANAGNSVILQEMLPGFDETWCTGTGGEHYVTELVVPMRLSDPPPVARPSLPRGDSPVVLTERSYPPGSEWLYLQFYGPRNLQDEVLAEKISAEVSGLLNNGVCDRWFFVRYSEGGDHLRLRFHGDPIALQELVLPRMLTLGRELLTSRHLTRISVDTYEAEVCRYGGRLGLAVCEEMFSTGSSFALPAIRLLRSEQTSFDLTEIALASLNAITESFYPNLADRHDFYCTLAPNRNDPAGQLLGKEFRAARERVAVCVGPTFGRREGKGSDLLQVLVTELRDATAILADRLRNLERSGALTRSLNDVLGSLLHMHCNRLLGTDQQAERRLFAFLERGIQAMMHAGRSVK